MAYPLDLTFAKPHPVTGFLDIPGDAFSNEQKCRFLNIFEKTGDAVKAMDGTGYSRRVLDAHLTADKAFAEALSEVRSIHRAKMEAALFQRGLQDTGDAARTKWLEANWPEKYGKKQDIPAPVAKETEEQKKLRQIALKVLEAKEVRDRDE